MMYLLANTQSSMDLGSKASVTRSRRDSMRSLTSPTFHHSLDEQENKDEIRTFQSSASHAYSSTDEHEDDDHLAARRTTFASSSYSQDSHHDHDHDARDLLSVDSSAQHSKNQYSANQSIASSASLSSEEKELLYLQLEDCISQMHAVVSLV
jgi:hypothetical protein